MRALLVVNPKATTTSERGRDVLVRALRSEVSLTVAYTRRRGHAATLAAEATNDGVDIVIAVGGDGTVNEAVNGILRAKPSADAADRPALAVVPGGSTNVFARAMGLPKDWADGTGVILEALRDGPDGPRCRTIGLGRADDRYFTFCAGLGMDAEVVRRVERARLRGRRSTLNLYFRAALAQYFLETEWRTHAIILERGDEPAEPDLAAVIVQNTAPSTRHRTPRSKPGSTSWPCGHCTCPAPCARWRRSCRGGPTRTASGFCGCTTSPASASGRTSRWDFRSTGNSLASGTR